MLAAIENRGAAPSPKSTLLDRSSSPRSRSFPDPSTKAVSAVPDMISLSAVLRLQPPEQGAPISMQLRRCAETCLTSRLCGKSVGRAAEDDHIDQRVKLGTPSIASGIGRPRSRGHHFSPPPPIFRLLEDPLGELLSR